MKNKLFLLLIMVVLIAVLSLIFWLKPSNQDEQHLPNQDTTLAQNDLNAVSNTSETLTIPHEDSTTLQKNAVSTGNQSNNEVFTPKVEWSDKTININGKTINYEFGKGNPEEVALSPEEYMAKDYKDGVPYVTPKAEQYLKSFLSDPNLPELLNKCVNFLNAEMVEKNPQTSPEDLPKILTNRDVDIENYLVIDRETGRKEINPDIDNRMNDLLNTLNNPLDRSPLAMECFGLNRMEDFNTIQSKFHELGREFTNTGKAIKGSEWSKYEEQKLGE